VSEHSRFSASNFDADAACPGRQVVTGRARLVGEELEQFIGGPAPVDRPSYDAAAGTATHTLLLDRALPSGLPAETWLGEVITVDGFQIIVDEDMCERVNASVAKVEAFTEGADIVVYEERVNYSAALGTEESHAWGTADLIAVFHEARHAIVYDYKNGRGVTVDVSETSQPPLYAHGVWARFPDIETFDLVIDQPRVFDELQIHRMTTADMERFAAEAQKQVAEIYRADSASAVPGVKFAAWAEKWLRPGEKQCRFCNFKAGCPALAKGLASSIRTAAAALPEEFDDLTEEVAAALEEPETVTDRLAAGLSIADQLEQLAKAYRSTGEQILLTGGQIRGWKLVAGKKGNRAWANATEAESVLKSMRLKVEEMYDQKLKSPTQITKALADSPRRLKKVTPLITQPDGKPHLAPVSDKRPALEIQPVENAFDNLEEVNDEDLI
jgi:hypothetical protein